MIESSLAVGARVYYVEGTSGWGSTFGGRPTGLWIPGSLSYTIADDEVTLTGYLGSSGDFEPPASLSGLPVTSVGFGSFEGNRSLVSITLPNSITRIEPRAFLRLLRTDFRHPPEQRRHHRRIRLLLDAAS